jgi:nitrite reductase/ring-hydroxylating ferredoxin subunit
VKTRFEVCPATDLVSGERIVADLDGIEVGVFNVGGEYYALKNDCPHQRAPLCEGSLTGLTTADAPGEFEYERDGEIVRCPWHGWEFDVTTGESVFNPHRVKAQTFETSVEESDDPDTVETSEPASATAGRLDLSTGTADSANNTEDQADDRTTADYDVALAGDEPPVDTYDAGVENGVVVVHL